MEDNTPEKPAGSPRADGIEGMNIKDVRRELMAANYDMDMVNRMSEKSAREALRKFMREKEEKKASESEPKKNEKEAEEGMETVMGGAAQEELDPEVKERVQNMVKEAVARIAMERAESEGGEEGAVDNPPDQGDRNGEAGPEDTAEKKPETMSDEEELPAPSEPSLTETPELNELDPETQRRLILEYGWPAYAVSRMSQGDADLIFDQSLNYGERSEDILKKLKSDEALQESVGEKENRQDLSPTESKEAEVNKSPAADSGDANRTESDLELLNSALKQAEEEALPTEQADEDYEAPELSETQRAELRLALEDIVDVEELSREISKERRLEYDERSEEEVDRILGEVSTEVDEEGQVAEPYVMRYGRRRGLMRSVLESPKKARRKLEEAIRRIENDPEKVKRVKEALSASDQYRREAVSEEGERRTALERSAQEERMERAREYDKILGIGS